VVIGRICTQGLSLNYNTLDQLAGSFSCIDVVYYVIHSFVCLFLLSVSRSFVRSFFRSIIRSLVRSINYSFVRLFSLIVHSMMVSLCLGSSHIPTNDFFYFNRWLSHDIPSPNFVLLLSSTSHEASHDGHSAAKQTDVILAFKCFPALDFNHCLSRACFMRLLLLPPFTIASAYFCLPATRRFPL